jgi:hypothetical protein
MPLTIRYIKYAPRIVEVAEETVPVDDVDALFEEAKRRLEEMKYKFVPAPNGVVIEDENGKRLREFVIGGDGGRMNLD